MKVMFGWAHMTQEEFNNLLDYSCSLPTGVIIGKKWKRRKHYGDESKGWLLGEYLKHDTEENKISIRWSEITIEEDDKTKE